MTALRYYAPDFRVAINSQEIPAVLRSSVVGIRYEDGVNAADRVEIDFANPDAYLLQNHIRGVGFRPFPTGAKVGPVRAPGVAGTFDLDNKVELALGYAGEGLSDMFRGEITGVEADFPISGVPTLKLVAHDYLHRMSEGKYARGFGPLPDAVIAVILSAQNLLVPMIDPAVAGASAAMTALNLLFDGTGRKQKGQTDLDLVKEIAQAYDADFWVDGDIFYLSRFIKEYEPRMTLTWGESLLAFNPRVSKVGQVGGVAIKFTLGVLPISFLVTASWDFDREALVFAVVPGEADTVAASAKQLIGPVITLIREPIESPADIMASAIKIVRKLREILNNRLTGVGSAVGDPRIRAGAVIRLDGLGPDFSGDYRVVGANHVLGSGGYRTEFKVRKEILP
jgi:phage protein D